jgi:hypothetical protein
MIKSLVLIALVATAATAAPIIIGSPADTDTGNCFPFGCAQGTRYQQVYDANQFSGPIDIGQILFFAGAFTGDTNQLATGSWDLFLSTTSKSVNGLDLGNFNANDGADNQLFATVTSNGSVIIPDTWIISGNTFHYDPSAGNLLLDIHANLTNSGNVFLDVRFQDAAGAFSRAHDFGEVFDDTGLVTGFDVGGSQAVPEPSSLPLLVAAAGLAALKYRKSAKRA